MKITHQSLNILNTAFNAAFKNAFEKPKPFYPTLCIQTNSTAKYETYGWMKEMFQMREYTGEIIFRNLEEQAYTLENKTFVEAVRVKRTDIEDDQLNLISSSFAQLGEAAAMSYDERLAEMIRTGLTSTTSQYGLAYDGKPFLASDHVGYDENGKEIAYSNYQTGAGKFWMLADLSRATMKPFLMQFREPITLESLTKGSDEAILNEHFVYKARNRFACGFAWWQLAFGSNATLDATNFQAAKTAMMSQRRPNGAPLGINPTHLIYGADNMVAAMSLLEKQNLSGGESNIWYKNVEGMLLRYL